MQITSKQLQLIRVVGELGSLAKAAHALGVTPSAVSQQISKFEVEVGAPLVQRTSQGTILTSLGAELAQHAGQVSRVLRDAEESVSRHNGRTATRLRVGAFTSVATTVVPEVLAALRLRHPNAEVTVTEMLTDEGTARVEQGELDVALIATYTKTLPVALGVEHTRLFTDPLRLIVPDDHALAARPEPVPLAEVGGETWACSMRSRPARSQVEALAASAGIDMSIPFQTESYDVVLALVGVGVAVGLVPETAVRDVPGTVVLECSPPASREIFAAMPEAREHVPLVDEFVSLLRKTWTR